MFNYYEAIIEIGAVGWSVIAGIIIVVVVLFWMKS